MKYCCLGFVFIGIFRTKKTSSGRNFFISDRYKEDILGLMGEGYGGREGKLSVFSI